MTDTLALLSGSPDSDPDCAIVRESHGPTAQIGSFFERDWGYDSEPVSWRNGKEIIFHPTYHSSQRQTEDNLQTFTHKHRHPRNMCLTDRHTHSCGCLSL